MRKKKEWWRKKENNNSTTTTEKASVHNEGKAKKRHYSIHILCVCVCAARRYLSNKSHFVSLITPLQHRGHRSAEEKETRKHWTHALDSHITQSVYLMYVYIRHSMYSKITSKAHDDVDVVVFCSHSRSTALSHFSQWVQIHYYYYSKWQQQLSHSPSLTK